MTPPAVGLPAPPLAAIETGLFLLAVPMLLLMGIWAVVTSYRILFPEPPPSPDPAARGGSPRRPGDPVPVRLRDIVAEQRRRPTPALMLRSNPRSHHLPGHGSGTDSPSPLADALWARRN